MSAVQRLRVFANGSFLADQFARMNGVAGSKSPRFRSDAIKFDKTQAVLYI